MKLLSGMFVLGFIAGALFLVTPCMAQDEQAGQGAVGGAQPQQIRVGVYVLNLGKFDVSSGAFTVDFYLSMTSDEPFEKNSFEFMNGRASSVDIITDEPKEKFYRIQANLFENVDLKAYPFDRHTLPIEIEEKNSSVAKLVYVADEKQSGIDSLVTFVGWELVGKPKSRVVEHDYAVYGEKYSRFIFDVNIRRIALAAILKAFLPVGFILFVGLLGLLIAVDKVPLRLTINTSTLLAAVMFHLNVTSALPPVGYLTFADKFMIVTYVSLILCLASTLLLMRHTDKGEETHARWIYRSSLTFVPLVTMGMFAVLFLWSRVS